MATEIFAQGGCACGAVRYQLKSKPMVVHSCHCTYCQRETGSAFAFNAVVETDNVDILTPDVKPLTIKTPSASGAGQDIVRCPKCFVALWSHYRNAGPLLAFVRAGTLDSPALVEPTAYIYTGTTLPWVKLPDDEAGKEKIFPEFYPDLKKVWTQDAQERWNALGPRIKEYHEQMKKDQ